jgi:hypothetical protein
VRRVARPGLVASGGPAAVQVVVVEVDADAGRVRRGGQDAEHQLAPSAADVQHRTGVVPGQALGQWAARADDSGP